MTATTHRQIPSEEPKAPPAASPESSHRPAERPHPRVYVADFTGMDDKALAIFAQDGASPAAIHVLTARYHDWIKERIALLARGKPLSPTQVKQAQEQAIVAAVPAALPLYARLSQPRGCSFRLVPRMVLLDQFRHFLAGIPPVPGGAADGKAYDLNLDLLPDDALVVMAEECAFAPAICTLTARYFDWTKQFISRLAGRRSLPPATLRQAQEQAVAALPAAVASYDHTQLGKPRAGSFRSFLRHHLKDRFRLFLTRTARRLAATSRSVATSTQWNARRLQVHLQLEPLEVRVLMSGTPTITDLSFHSAPISGGSTVAISGTNLDGMTRVDFGDTRGPMSWVDSASGQVMAYVPSHAAGSVDVTVTTPDGISSPVTGDQFSFVAPTLATISAISPNSGPTAGGTSVVISGTDLNQVTGVSFDGSSAMFSYNSMTGQIAVSAPMHAPGLVDVTVSSSAGTSATSAADQFTYQVPPPPTVDQVSPNAGSPAGGDLVTITGTNFTTVSSVTFDGTPSGYYWAPSSTQLEVYTPTHSVGTVNIVVTAAGGTSALQAADQYTYQAPAAPSITRLSPDAGPTAGGNLVTIDGSNFTNVTGVTFGGISSSYYWASSSTQLQAYAPAQAAGLVDVVVSAAGGASNIQAADQYTYEAPAAPSISSITPNSGPTGGGTYVVIDGAHLDGVTGVSFGGTPAGMFSYNAMTQKVGAYSPAHLAGSVAVSVTTPGGTAEAANAFEYVTPSLPVISSISPGSGPTRGYTTVLLSGTDLDQVTGISFGGATAMFRYDPMTGTIAVTVPPHVPGVVDVTVTSNAATSGVVQGIQFEYQRGDVFWTGHGVGYSWNNPANWSTNDLPGPWDDVTVNEAPGVTVIETGGAWLHSLTTSSPMNFRGDLHLATTSEIMGTFTFNGTLDLAQGILTLGGGGTIAGLLTAEAGAAINLTGGTFALTSGGFAGQGSIGVGSAAILNISGFEQKYLEASTVRNAGTIVWTDQGNIAVSSNVTFTNLAGAVFDIQNDASFIDDGMGSMMGTRATMNNAGALKKSEGTGTTEVGVTINNTGIVAGEVGTMKFTAGGVNTGMFSGVEGSNIEFATGTYELAEGTVVAGPGMLVVGEGGIAEIAGDLTEECLVLGEGGIIRGGVLTVTEKAVWIGGSMEGPGRTVSRGDLEIDGNAAKTLNGRKLELRVRPANRVAAQAGAATVAEGLRTSVKVPRSGIGPG